MTGTSSDREGAGAASRIASGTAASLARIGVTFLVWFLLTPYMVRSLGSEGYGLWSLLFSLVGFLGLLDLGTGAGVVRAVAEARGHGRAAERDETLSTYLASSLTISATSVLIVALLDRFALPALGVPAAVLPAARLALWLVALRSFILAVPLGFLRGVLFGENRLISLNAVQAAATALTGVLTALALRAGLGLAGVAGAGLLGMLIEHAGYLYLARPYLAVMDLSWRHVSRRALRRASSLGLAQLLIAASGLILLRTDPIIVQAFVGMAAVSLYAVAMKIAENTFILIKQFVNALSPVIAEWHAAGKSSELRDLLLRATRLALIPAALIGGAAVGGGASLLRLWLGPEFVAAALPMRILVLAMILTVPQMVVFGLLTYSDRHQLPARASLVAAVLNVAFSVVLVRPLGLAGVALGTLLATLVVDVLYVLREGAAAFGVPFLEIASKALWPTLAPFALLSGILALWVRALPPANLIDLALRIGLALVFVSMILARTALEPSEREALIRRAVNAASALRFSVWRTA